MLKGGTVLRLQELKAQGKSLREISRETGFSRNTVRRYLRDGHLPKEKVQEKRGSKLDPFKSLFKKVIHSDGKQKCTPAKNGKMEVPLHPFNQRREVHFYGFAA